jgi:putative membrane-bound dehydrogenase-like protein
MKSTLLITLLLHIITAKSVSLAADDATTEQAQPPAQYAKLSPEQEAKILQDVKVQDGFEASLFAAPPLVNYPIFVAAALDGTVYVSSDGNCSSTRLPHRGRVIRLRDTDADGRADEVKEFIKDVDAPRGLLWDHDRLYLMHPPHLSAYLDKNADGVADEEKILVKNLAFGYDQRAADHTTNGVSMGMDGYLYIAGGDFGFINAEGTDGRKLTHRGGGVIRVRPDGTGLELYSTGTRNILEVAISPDMQIFARDNTNDGGGWNVRLHHFTGHEDHGYPRLFKHFAEECVAPLADYGGGSGCGAVYIHEAGFGKWNAAPFTCDWGSNALWRHELKPQGATYTEVKAPEPFVQLTRPTDADVDAQGRLYLASWKGATYSWAGPDVGYIVRIKAKDSSSAERALPDFEKATDEELAKLKEDPSYRVRLAAMRSLQRRNSPLAPQRLAQKQLGTATPERVLVDSLPYEANDAEVISALSHKDALVAHTAVRIAAERKLAPALLALLDQNQGSQAWQALARMHTTEVVAGLIQRLEASPQLAAKKDILRALCRLHYQEAAWTPNSKGEYPGWGTRPDTRGPYYELANWSESPAIATALKSQLEKASAEEATFLINEMNRNRIQFHEALERILALASKDPHVLPEAMAQLTQVEHVPSQALPLVMQALQATNSNEAQMILHAVSSAVKTDQADVWALSLKAVATLHGFRDKANKHLQEYELALAELLNAPKLENHHVLLETLAEKQSGPLAFIAEQALITLASRKTGSPESRELSLKALHHGWEKPERRLQILQVLHSAGSHLLDDRVLASVNDPDPNIASAAKAAVDKLKLKPKEADHTPKIASLKPEEAVAAVLKHKGDRELGEQLFTKASCVACHTVRESEAQKGPYLGNIAQTFKREDLAWNILDPNRSIAQGFSTELVALKSGDQQMGFITLEGANEIKMRNIAAQEFTYKTGDIAQRTKLPASMMPPMLMAPFSVHEFASLLDYLEYLAKPH